MLRVAASAAAAPGACIASARRCSAAPQHAPAPLAAPRRHARGASLVAAARDRSKPASDKPASPPPRDKTASPAPPPLTASSVDEGAPPRDFWEGEQFEALGTFGYVALFIVAGLAAIAGGVASSTYNDGAVGVDFQAAGSADKAVATALAAAGAKPAPPL